MRDFSVNLPSWAYNTGYRLEGGAGTYDELYLYKDGRVVKKWDWLERVPNISELEEFIEGLNSSTTSL